MRAERLPGSIPTILLDAIRKAGSTGLCRGDLPAMGGRLATYRDELSRLFSAGKIFAAGAHINRRWFWCEADALIWEQQRPRTQAEFRHARRIETAEIKAARLAQRLAKLAEPRGKQPVWPPEHVAILRAMYAEHGPGPIAAKTGHTRSAVGRKAMRLGIKCLHGRGRRAGPPKPPRESSAPKPAQERQREPLAGHLMLKPGTSVTKPPKVRGPADMPGEPIFTERTKWTIVPPSPAHMRTNTHSIF